MYEYQCLARTAGGRCKRRSVIGHFCRQHKNKDEAKERASWDNRAAYVAESIRQNPFRSR